MPSATAASMLFLTSLLCWHYDWGQSLLTDHWYGAPCRVGIFFHVRMERLRLASIYFQVADATYGAVGP